MEIIVEYAIIDNLTIDFIIFFLSHKMLKIKMQKLRVFLSCAVGTVFALLFPMFYLPSVVMLFLKLILGFTMCLIAFKYSNIKTYLKQFFIFISITFLLGGVSFGICYMLTGEPNLNTIINNIFNFPISVIYLILFAYCYLLLNAINYFNNRKNYSKYVFNVYLYANQKTIETKGYLDSGNVLFEPTTNKPIVVMGYKTFSKLFGNISVDKILLQRVKDEDIKGCSYMPIKTINSKSSTMLIFPISHLVIDEGKTKKETDNVLGGLSLYVFSKSFGCDVLLNPSLI